jgi:hypothetical protein
MTMSKILPSRLVPGGAWFYWRLKIYVWVALASAWMFLLVATWMPEPSQDRSFAKDIMSVITAFYGAAIAFWSSRSIKGLEGERHHHRHRL